MEKPKYSMVSADYKLLEEIGQGVSGVVYRAIFTPSNDVVAVKQLNLERCNADLDNIRKEAQLMTLMSHPNVVTAYCSFVVGQHLWVIMPYHGGGSCLHIMQAAFPDGLEEAVIATILRETLRALEYLHRLGHIHRDVKAGNILIDDVGGVKLGDFGISACMFDTGDRQWSRKTFVGTPCWMAPEVFEMLNGYDFKADIWSFGITALELAHGHAPFSKFPPMKVLLMTLQSNPPGLNYDRDRRFSKSFKEMIAMCLVKDPTKRPTAEKLLKHSFFKSAKPSDYITRNVLEGLPPLPERVRNVKLKDAARLADKKMPYDEQEKRSQSEYKRGVSGWNFDVEDLKAQAALIQEDEYPKKEDESSVSKGAENISRVASPFLSTLSSIPSEENFENHQLPETISQDADECVLRTTSLPCPKPLNGAKIRGRFNVFVDNVDVDASTWCEGMDKIDDCSPPKENGTGSNGRCDEREAEVERLATSHDAEEHFSEHAASSKSPDNAASKSPESEKDRDHRHASRLGDEHSRERVNEHRTANGVTRSPPGPCKEEDKVKGHVVQKKGRFSVTSADVEIQLKDLKESKDLPTLPCVKVKSNVNLSDHGGEVLSPSSMKKTAAQVYPTLQQVPPQQSTSPAPPASAAASAVQGVAAVGVILPQLQNLLNQTAMQQDMIVSLMTNVCSGEAATGSSNQRLSRSYSVNAVDHAEALSDRERELRQLVSELQARVGVLVDELQMYKSRNVQLERQLNAIFNKEEEERIRKEDAAKEDS